jgi:hypothetical protein
MNLEQEELLEVSGLRVKTCSEHKPAPIIQTSNLIKWVKLGHRLTISTEVTEDVYKSDKSCFPTFSQLVLRNGKLCVSKAFVYLSSSN